MKTIFHVGYRKCASTFLQHVVFSRHPELHMVERTGLPRYVAFTPEVDYDARLVSERILHERKLCQQRQKSRIVISEERMLTVPGIDSGLISRRIFDIDRDAIIIIVIRNQQEFLLSNHSQSVATGKTKLYSFNVWLEAIRSSGDRNTYLDKANFYDQVRAFDALFGPSRVGVFLLEDMRADPASFAGQLGEFVGIDLSGPQYDLGRHGHVDSRSGKRSKMARSSRWSILTKSSPTIRVVDGLLRPITLPVVRRTVGRVTGLGAPHNRLADSATGQWIAERYRESNKRLAERLGRDLSRLGYAV